MKNTRRKVSEQNAIIAEMETFFTIQEKYFNDRTEANLQKVRIQTAKVKQMIRDSKKPEPKL